MVFKRMYLNMSQLFLLDLVGVGLKIQSRGGIQYQDGMNWVPSREHGRHGVCAGTFIESPEDEAKLQKLLVKYPPDSEGFTMVREKRFDRSKKVTREYEMVYWPFVEQGRVRLEDLRWESSTLTKTEAGDLS